MAAIIFKSIFPAKPSAPSTPWVRSSDKSQGEEAGLNFYMERKWFTLFVGENFAK